MYSYAIHFVTVHCNFRTFKWNEFTFILAIVLHELIDIGFSMAFRKAFLEQCILKCFLTLILVGGHNWYLDLCGNLSTHLWKLLLVFSIPACGIKFFPCFEMEWAWMCGIGIIFKVTWKSFVVIYVLMLKSIVAYLHGHIRMLIAFSVLFLEFEFIVLRHTFSVHPNHFATFHGVWFCLTVSKFCFSVLS